MEKIGWRVSPSKEADMRSVRRGEKPAFHVVQPAVQLDRRTGGVAD